mgnify:CR=1 FL=1
MSWQACKSASVCEGVSTNPQGLAGEPTRSLHTQRVSCAETLGKKNRPKFESEGEKLTMERAEVYCGRRWVCGESVLCVAAGLAGLVLVGYETAVALRSYRRTQLLCLSI